MGEVDQCDVLGNPNDSDIFKTVLQQKAWQLMTLGAWGKTRCVYFSIFHVNKNTIKCSDICIFNSVKIFFILLNFGK